MNNYTSPAIFDVICVGNVTIDAFLKIDDLSSFELNKEKKQICIKIGDKILADDCEFLPGGNACNVSVGLSRLDLKTAICAEMGDDEFSQKILNGLTENKVNLSFLKKSKNKDTSFAVIFNFANERTVVARKVEREHDFTFEGISSKWMYLTSLGNKWKEAYKKAMEFADKNNIKLAFAPGSTQLKEALSEEVLSAIKKADIIFVNKEEAMKLATSNLPAGRQGQQLATSYQGKNDKEFIEQLLKILQGMGAKTVVITDGENGSTAIDQNGKIFFLEAKPAKIVEKTGAGDAFASGFLSAIIRGSDISQAMVYGSINGAAVVEKVGSQPGLLTKEEIEERFKKI